MDNMHLQYFCLFSPGFALYMMLFPDLVKDFHTGASFRAFMESDRLVLQTFTLYHDIHIVYRTYNLITCNVPFVACAATPP